MNLPVSAILFDGVLVGLVTGLIGVGGGFLLVPALALLAGLPIQAAIGTSLFIIVLQSLAALAGHANHMSINIELTLLVTSCAVFGSLIGGQLTKIIDSQYLKRGFGVFVFLLGSFLLYQEISAELIAQIKQLLIEHKEFIKGASTIIVTLMLYRLWSRLH
nr:sulfite exporter TauE/SafE family protein [Methylomarinum sp. Ch1-1]MDP4519748.1 sulfite exporter TauE/SafE family protein [Methylomarinum sp. Ch1-1]